MLIRAVRRCSGAGLWSIERPLGRSAERPCGWTIADDLRSRPRRGVAATAVLVTAIAPGRYDCYGGVRKRAGPPEAGVVSPGPRVLRNGHH